MADDKEQKQEEKQEAKAVLAWVYVDASGKPKAEFSPHVKQHKMFALTCAQLFIGEAAKLEDAEIQAKINAQLQAKKSKVLRPGDIMPSVKVVD